MKTTTILLLVAATLEVSCSRPETHTVLISGYNRKLNVFNITGGGHIVTKVSELDVDGSLSWLEVDGDNMYAIHEDSNLVSHWRLSRDFRRLERLERLEMPSSGPAHLAVDKRMGLVFSANYGGGSWTVISLDSSGRLGEVRQHEQFSGSAQCAVSHPHQTVIRGDNVWLVDLGCDKVWHFQHREGRLERRTPTNTPPGCGPRHMTLHPDNQRAFLLCEQDSLVLVYRVHEDGRLTETQRVTLSSVPADYGAELLLNKAGDRLYASSRGSGVIVVYRVTDQGLEREDNVFNMTGSWPRHFALQREILLTTDQRGSSAQVVHVDSQGLLLPGKTFTVEEQPAFVTFLSSP